MVLSDRRRREQKFPPANNVRVRRCCFLYFRVAAAAAAAVSFDDATGYSVRAGYVSAIHHRAQVTLQG